MNWNNINQAASIAAKIHNMHVTLRGQAKGLRKLNRRVTKLTAERDALLAQRQNLLDLLDSRDHDIQTLRMTIAEMDGSMPRAPLHDDTEACDARR